jgi:hypothetical protein
MANLRLKFPTYSKKMGTYYKSRIVLKDASIEECIAKAKGEFNIDMTGKKEQQIPGFLYPQYVIITGK